MTATASSAPSSRPGDEYCSATSASAALPQHLVPVPGNQPALKAMPTVSKVVSILDAARQVRAGLQHVGAQPRAMKASTALGLTYPVADWPSASRQIQAAVAPLM